MLESASADKFGQRRARHRPLGNGAPIDDEGIELSTEERKDDYLERLAARE